MIVTRFIGTFVSMGHDSRTTARNDLVARRKNALPSHRVGGCQELKADFSCGASHEREARTSKPRVDGLAPD